MEKPLLSPANDYVFKRIFGDERNRPLLISILEAVLEISISDVVLAPSILAKETETVVERDAVLDIVVITDQGIRIVLEMQVAFQREYTKRVLFYTSKLYTNQLKKGSSFSTLNKAVSITFLNDTTRFFPHFHSVYLLSERWHNPPHSLDDILEVHFIDMLRLRLGESDLATITEPLKMWTAFLTVGDRKVLEMLAKKDTCIGRAVMVLEQMSQSDIEIIHATSREKFLMDQVTRDSIHREEGIVIGEKRGRQEGRQEGIIEAATKLVSGGMDKKTVCEMLGMSESDLL